MSEIVLGDNMFTDISMFHCSMSKILKCANNDDAITLKSADDSDKITLMFESPSKFHILPKIMQ